mmetsp:Transcript_12610/g.36058  ORF Transcript_12610/g.36058 Transcript_12610/m.36058 type:complete len:232 (+) Transcript_12610:1223-1918(+)
MADPHPSSLTSVSPLASTALSLPRSSPQQRPTSCPPPTNCKDPVASSGGTPTTKPHGRPPDTRSSISRDPRTPRQAFVVPLSPSSSRRPPYSTTLPAAPCQSTSSSKSRAKSTASPWTSHGSSATPHWVPPGVQPPVTVSAPGLSPPHESDGTARSAEYSRIQSPTRNASSSWKLSRDSLGPFNSTPSTSSGTPVPTRAFQARRPSPPSSSRSQTRVPTSATQRRRHEQQQ